MYYIQYTYIFKKSLKKTLLVLTFNWPSLVQGLQSQKGQMENTRHLHSTLRSDPDKATF